MTTSGDEQKSYEDRLQRRLIVLREQLDAGKIKFASGMKIIESLKAIRYAPDGTVDLSTVDGLVRSAALAIEHLHDREEIKREMPLNEIQNTYFTFLDQNFGAFYKIMRDRGLTPHDAGIALSRNPETAEKIAGNISEFLNTIEEFWKQSGDAAHAHVEDMHGALKGVFGGDFFPSHSKNIASTCGLYTDTIVLPDPFLRSKYAFERWSRDDQAYYLIKHGLNLLQYRELACFDVVPPIVIVLPDITALEDQERKFILNLGQQDALIHAGKVFGREFKSSDELMEYAVGLDSVDKVVAAVSDPRRVLFDTEWQGTLQDQLKRAAADKSAKLLKTDNPGIIVASQAIGRMSTSNELLIKASRLGGTPIIDAPTSWQYLVWKLEYDARAAESVDRVTDLHVVRGLQELAENEMEWLGNVPVDALLEIRRTGAIKEIREVLSKGITNLAGANATNFHRTSDQVFDNIQAAFSDHRKKIEELQAKKWKFAGSDIGSWIVVGSLAITAAATGTPAWGLAAVAADQLLDAPKLKDIPKSILELADETRKVKRSPVGMLFKHAQQRT